MLKHIFTVAALSASLASASVFAQTFKADVSKSSIAYLAKKVTGKHEGAVKLTSGSLTLDGDAIKAGTFDVDMNSITCSDLTGEWNDKFIGHLKSDDFFSTAKFPKATLVITEGKKDATGAYLIKGNLTIKGITKPISFPATLKKEGNTVTSVATIVVDRTVYDIRYGSKSFFDDLGDKAIDNDFTLTVTLVATK
jgi:polyisoprenoid-binding protein YceI